MNALTRANISRLFAGFMLAGVLFASGHHFFIVATAKAHTAQAEQNHEERHQHEPSHSTSAMEAHTIAAVIQKYQISKLLEITAFIFRPFEKVAIAPRREVALVTAAIDEPPQPVPLDLKTTFLN